MATIKQAKSWQNKMEGPLTELEKLGALSAEMADEIRNIVAEGIAEKFQERYRPFPGEREGVEIRRDRVPAACTLRKCFDAHAKAIKENTLPAPIEMARRYGNLQPHPKARETPNGQDNVAPSRVVAKEQSAAKGSWDQKPDTASGKKASSGKKSGGNRKAAYSSSGRTGQIHEHWETELTSNTDEKWSSIYSDPYAVVNKLPSSAGSRKAQEDATTASQASESAVPTKKPTTECGWKDTASSVSGTSSAEATATAVKLDADGEKDVVAALSDVKLAERQDYGMTTETEENGTSVSQPAIDFGDDLIWFSD